MTVLTLIVTDAGRAAIVNARNTGFAAVEIARAGVSPTAVVPNRSTVALPGEVKRIATIGGTAVGDDVIHVLIRDESADTYAVRSFALYLADGTLFAIYGQADPILEKSASALMLLAVDATLVDVSAAEVVFGDTSFVDPPASEDRAGVVKFSEVIRRAYGSRPLSYDYAAGSMRIAANSGNWASGYRFQDEAGALLGGFGAVGTGSALAYHWIGATHDAANALRVYPDRVTWNNGPVWHSANDGAGSGLDADLLDGRHASQFAELGGATFIGPVVLKDVQYPSLALLVDGVGTWRMGGVGDGATAFGIRLNAVAPFFLIDSAGASTFQNDQMLPSIKLLHREIGAWTLGGIGPDLKFGIRLNNIAPSLVIDTAGAVSFSLPVTRAGSAMWDAANDGAGSGLDADLLDGQQGAWYADVPARLGFAPLPAASYTATDALAKLVTVDGAGSGLDADLLDGQQGAWYADVPARLGFAPLPAASYTAADALAKLVTVDGAGSGLDADLLDGQQGAWYADVPARLGFAPLPAASYTAGDALAKLVTVDGAGSGLDADLLDGWQRDDVRDWNNLLNRPATYPPAPHTHVAADLAPAFATRSLSADGYQVLPGGLILQWVSGSTDGAGTEATQQITYPVAFPNAALRAFVSTDIPNPSDRGDCLYQLVGTPQQAYAIVQRQRIDTTRDSVSTTPHLFVIGY